MQHVKESWLRSSDHAKFGRAMGRCKHNGGHCASDGFCHFEGSCFNKSVMDEADQLDRIELKLDKILKLLQHK